MPQQKINRNKMIKEPVQLATSKRFRTTDLVPYIFISPFFIMFIIFMLYPILYSLVLSFSKWSSSKMSFVGLDNYKHLLTDTVFLKALINTGEILLIQVPVMLLLATLIAVMVNSQLLKCKTFFRTSFFLPVLIDLVTYSLVFSLLFNENYGLINQSIKFFGAQPIGWGTNAIWAKLMVVIAITWRWTGYNSIIILSGLQMIPSELYEAASIDGASNVVAFFKITIPQLKPVLLFCMILSTIGTLKLFVEPYMLTRGGPNNGTLTVMYYLYDTAFGSFNFGLASAGAYIVTILIAVLSYFQMRLSKGGEN